MKKQSEDTGQMPPKPIADIVIRHDHSDMLDAFFEDDELYDRFMKEAPGYGEVSHCDNFVRLFVAPTFNPDVVKIFLERPLSSEHL